MKKKYKIVLSDKERKKLNDLLSRGKHSSQKFKRARVMLLSSDGATDSEIISKTGLSRSGIFGIRKRYINNGFKSTLDGVSRPGRPRKMIERLEAYAIATACSEAPVGRNKWTMQLIADRLVELKLVDSISDETVRLHLKKKIKPWLHKQWCIAAVNAEFVYRMEDILDLYHSHYDPKRPRVCIDEKLYQLIMDIIDPIPMTPEHLRREDYTYKRNGTCNIFMIVSPEIGWRHLRISDQRRAIDYAETLKELVDVWFPDAEKIVLVSDNLNIHTGASLYKKYEPEEARRILKKLEFHYTPKHASWLNMAEIELSILGSQCINRRIGDKKTLIKETKVWEEKRNQCKAKINWNFTSQQARVKLKRSYPNV